MKNIAIKVENLSKAYQLGQFSTGTLSRDLERWWYRLRGKEDPFLRIGETNDRTVEGKSNIVWSLKDVNFEIEQGDAIGIIGRNGAGKSTLLKVLSQITSPTTGTVGIKGRIASLLEVGTGFHPELTGRENIYLNGAILGMRKKEISRKFDEIVDFSGVARYIDTPVKRYSSGMYVRLAFAVAANLESEILIVDEVLAVGDTEFQKKCLGKMGEVSKGQGRTVLFVSHNLASIKSLCNKGIYLKNGSIEQIGSVNDVLSLYKKSTNGVFTMDGNSNLSTRIDRCAASGRVAGLLRFTSLAILDASMNEATVFHNRESVNLEIGYEAFDDVEGFGIAIRLESADSGDVITSNFIPVTKQQMPKGHVGKVIVKFSNLSLQPGDYLPYLVAVNNNREPYDVIDKLVMNVPLIEIENTEEDTGEYIEIPYDLTIVK